MELSKLNPVEFCEYTGSIEKCITKEVGGRDRYKNNFQIHGVFSIGVDMRIAKKAIDILRKCMYVTKYVYVGALSGRYMTYLVCLLDCEGSYVIENKVIEYLKFSIYKLLDNGKNGFTTSKEYEIWANTHRRGMIIEHTGGSELLIFECYGEDVAKIKKVLKNNPIHLVDYKDIRL